MLYIPQFLGFPSQPEEAILSLKEDRPSPFTVNIPLKPMSIAVVMSVWRTISHPKWPIASNVYLEIIFTQF